MNLLHLLSLFLLYLLHHSMCFSTAEYRLDNDILSKYRSHLRPVTDPKDRIVVNVSIFSFDFLKFDEDTSTATINLFLRKEWFDQLLQWSPGRYSGLMEIHVPAERLWRPDIVLISGADPIYTVVHQPLARVQHSGRVRWSVHLQPKVFCKHNYEEFPMDEPTCTATFEAWSYDQRQLDLRLRGLPQPGIPRSSPIAKDWQLHKLRAATGQSPAINSSSGPLHYASLHITMQLRRRFPHLARQLQVPAAGLALLQPCFLLLRPSRSERLLLQFSTFLALCGTFFVQWSFTPRALLGLGGTLRLPVVAGTVNVLLIVWSIAALHLWHRRALVTASSPFWRCMRNATSLMCLTWTDASAPQGCEGRVKQPRASFVRIDDKVDSQVDSMGPWYGSPSSNGTTTLDTPLSPSSFSGEQRSMDYSTSSPVPPSTLPPNVSPPPLRLRIAEEGPETPQRWRLLALFGDRLLFLLFSIVTAITIIACLV